MKFINENIPILRNSQSSYTFVRKQVDLVNNNKLSELIDLLMSLTIRDRNIFLWIEADP